MEVVFMRHGQTAWNAEHRLQGANREIVSILEQAGDVDFVVTLVGANDLYNQRTPEAAYASWCELVARIRAQKPHAKILALNLPDRPDISNEEEFNARFAADVARGTFGAKCLYPVDLYSLLPREDENFWRGTDVGAPERAGMAKLAANAIWGVDGVAFIQDFYFSGLLLVTCFAIVIFASLTAPAPDAAHLNGLNFNCLDAQYRKENRESWNWVDVVASAFVVGCVIAAYVYFWTWLG